MKEREEKNNKLRIVFICFVIVVCVFPLENLIEKNRDFLDIMQGDFSKVYDLNENEILEMDVFFEDLDKNDNTKWMFWDFDLDGMKELILMENNNDNINKIYAVFRKEGRKYDRILWDVSDSGEFYFLGQDNLIYHTQYQGIFQYECYSECSFDERWEMTIQKRLEIFGVTDLKEWSEIPNDFLSLDYPEIEKEGIGYYITLNCQDTLDRKDLTEKEWIEAIEKMIGMPFDAIKPEWYDAIRFAGDC